MKIMEFYEKEILSRGRVDCLYRIDMTKLLVTIEKSAFLMKLESIIGKNPIFDLVVSFLEIGFLNMKYEAISFEEFSIPPAGFLTNVLLNLELNKLDNEIAKFFPSIKSNRYIHFVYISNCGENEISSLVKKLSLAGVIYSIKPGTHANCFVGKIGLTKKGKIYVL